MCVSAYLKIQTCGQRFIKKNRGLKKTDIEFFKSILTEANFAPTYIKRPKKTKVMTT